MGRQVLTLLMLFVGAMLLMKQCSPKEELPAAVRTIRTPEPDAAKLVLLSKADVRVLLDASGRIVSVSRGADTILRSVSPTHRPLQMLVRLASGATQGLKPTGWTSVELPEGWEFTHTEGQRIVRKRISINDAGDALRVTLKMEGGDQDLHGLELTAVSGVEFDGQIEGGALLRIGEDPVRYIPFDACVQFQEGERAALTAAKRDGREIPASPTYYRRLPVVPGQKVRRFGVLGSSYLVSLEHPPAVEAANIEAYRADRDTGVTDEIEAWISATALQGTFEGEFELAWRPRDQVELPGLKQQGMLAAAREYTLENDEFKAVFTDRGAALQQLWLKKFTQEAGQEPGPDTWIPILRNGVRPGSRALTLKGSAETFGASPAHQVWEAKVGADGSSIRFTLDTPRGWQLIKEITLPAPGTYDLPVDIRVRRPDNDNSETIRYGLVGPAGVYIEDAFRGITVANQPEGVLLERRGGEDDDADLKSLSGGQTLLHKYSEALDRGLLRAVAVRGSYFVCALVTAERTDDKSRPVGDVSTALVKGLEMEQEVERPDGDKSRENILGEITCDLDLQGGSAEASYRLYAGPNSLDDLRPLEIEGTVDFGFFGAIGRALMWLMKMLQGLTGSFGVAIMLMTLIVRASLMPVSYKTQLGMQRYSKRLQKIKPELDAITKKYADNKEKLNRERMRVMRENKVGFPLGCLMIFFQIPIWFALFAALRVEFSIRHQPFLWATDLSMPDRLFALPEWFANLPVMPDYFNLLPLVMLVLWVIQNKLSRPPTANDDPNVAMQMKMVKYMPYIFFFMLYNYASALALYMCMSSAWGIVESKLVRRAVAKLD